MITPGPESRQNNEEGESWELRLYVAGQTPKSVAALANLRRICEEHLAGKYHIEIIDLIEQPQLAKGDQILAIPTLIRNRCDSGPCHRESTHEENLLYSPIAAGLCCRCPGGRRKFSVFTALHAILKSW